MRFKNIWYNKHTIYTYKILMVNIKTLLTTVYSPILLKTKKYIYKIAIYQEIYSPFLLYFLQVFVHCPFSYSLFLLKLLIR